MKRALLTFAAAALASAVCVGLTGPAASAAPAGKAKTVVSAPASDKTTKRLSVEKWKVSSLITHKDAALARQNRVIACANLGPSLTEAVISNVSGDRDALGELGAAAQAATTLAEVRAVSRQVHHVRPEVYSSIVNGLRQTARFQEHVAANTATLDELAAQADAKELEGFDVTAVRDAIASATVANDEAATFTAAAADRGAALTAFSTRDARAAFRADIAAAGERLDAVDEQLQVATDALAAMVAVEEPAA